MRTDIVTIDRPARYAKQLASHLGHKLTVTEVDRLGLAVKC